MLYKTHIAGGLALGYITFNNFNILNVDVRESNTLIVITAGLILGSLFPDIDHKKSYLSQKVKPISFITSKIFRHREFTHSIVGTVIVSYLLYTILSKVNIEPIYTNMFLKSFVIGIASHIFLDMLTVSGVVLFYPFYKKRVGINIFNHSRIEAKETLITIFCILIAIISYIF